MSERQPARHVREDQSGEDAGGRRRGVWAVLAAVAVVAVLVGAAFGFGLFDGGSTGQDASPTTTEAAATPTASDTPSSQASHQPGASADPAAVRAADRTWLRGCAAKLADADSVVTAAVDGARDWRDHVQARTDMLDGRMSVDDMDAVWARTRQAGPDDQQRFHTAMNDLDPAPRCRRPAQVAAADEQAVSDCVTRAQTSKRAMAAAEAMMADWEVHLTNMAAYADHQMSRTMAQDKWVRSWRTAPRNLDAYRGARADLAEAPECAGPTG